jgi:hypothetical protein
VEKMGENGENKKLKKKEYERIYIININYHFYNNAR